MSEARKTKAELLAELAALRRDLAGARAEAESARASDPAAEDRSRLVLEQARAVVVETDGRGRVTWVSPSVTEILGYEPGELLERPGSDWLHEADRASLVELFREVIARGGGARATVRARHKNGRWVWLETSLGSYRTAAGGTRTLGVARDVTAVAEAHEALDASEQRYRALAENAHDLISEVDAGGRILFMSPNCEAVLGHRPEELLGRRVQDNPVLDTVHPDSKALILGQFWPEIAAGRASRLEWCFRHPDGSWRWLESTGRHYETGAGEWRSVLISRDVTERVRAAQELRRSEERYRVLVETAGYVVSESDIEGRLLYASPNLVDLCGYTPEELIGTTPVPLVHPEDVERTTNLFLQGLETGKPTHTEPYRFRHKNGGWRWMDGVSILYERADGERIRLGMTRDITDRVEAEQRRRELEERMQQAQKLEGLGVMAGGIAHDFNNLLTPILGDTSLALLDLPPESPVRARLQKVQKAAHRAAALTHQMLTYAGEESLHVEVLNLSRLVQEMAQLLETAASRESVLVYDLASALPPIEGDAARVSQIVMNLITNASEALEGEGRITLRTGVEELEAPALARMILGSELPAGRYVFVEVADTGCGMDAETRARIFDPFFTTKFTGRGLGLAAVLGIVRAHQGAIDLESEPGRGTRFRVYFPVAASRILAHPTPPARAPERWRASGTLLVIDDEEGVRDLARDTLERAGFRVYCARDGREALEIFERHVDEIRLVLLDRTMPTTSGEETFEGIRRLRPRARVILVSGYSRRRASERFRGKGLDGFLEKPFLPATLLERVREVLERP
jgi:PAS domain S-box-containing protein